MSHEAKSSTILVSKQQQQGSSEEGGLQGTSAHLYQLSTHPRSPRKARPSSPSPSPRFKLPVVPLHCSTSSTSRSSSRASSGRRSMLGSLKVKGASEETKTAREAKNHRRGLFKILRVLRPRSAEHKRKGSQHNPSNSTPTSTPFETSPLDHQPVSAHAFSPAPSASSPSLSTHFPDAVLHSRSPNTPLRPSLVRTHSAPDAQNHGQQPEFSATGSLDGRRIETTEDGHQALEVNSIDDYRFPPSPQRPPSFEPTPQGPHLPPTQTLPVPISPLILPSPRSPIPHLLQTVQEPPQEDLHSLEGTTSLFCGGQRRDSGLSPLPNEVSHWSTTESTGSSSGDSRRPSTVEIFSTEINPYAPVLTSKFSDWTLSTQHSSLLSTSHVNLSDPSLAVNPSRISNSRRSSAMEHLLDSPSPPPHPLPSRSIAVQTDPSICFECCETFHSSWGDEETARGPRVGGGRWSVSPRGGGEATSTNGAGEGELSMREALAAFEDGCARAELRRRLLEAGLDGKGGWGGGVKGGSPLRGHEEMDREAREERVRLLEDETSWRIESFRRAGDIILRM